MWQSDVTHWQLADGTDVGSSTGSTTTPDTCSQRPLTSPSPATTWSRCSCRPSTNTARRPAPDQQRAIYTAGSAAAATRSNTSSHCSASARRTGPPATRRPKGKIERFHQTQKRWLAARPTPRTTIELQRQLDEFRENYNEYRPHRALDRATQHTPTAPPPRPLRPADHAPQHYRLRYDRLDTTGKMTLRRAGRMHHLGIGRAHAANASSRSPTTTTSPRSSSRPARSSPATSSNRTGPTGATKTKGPAAGQLSPTRPMTRLTREHVPTHHKAERVGFEPTRQFDPPTRFPVVHLKPLGHLSGGQA